MKKHLILVIFSLIGGSLFAQPLDKEAAESAKEQVIAEWKSRMSELYDDAYNEHIIRRDG